MEKATPSSTKVFTKLKKQSMERIRFGLQMKLTIFIVILMFVIISLSSTVMGIIGAYLENTLFLNIVSAIVSILLGAIGAFLIIRIFIKKPLYQLMILAKHFSENDFTKQVDIKTKDEFGQLASAFNDMGTKFQIIIKEISDSSNQVFEFAGQVNENTKQIELSASEVAEAIQEIAQGSELQAQSSDESANAVEEMTTGIQSVATSAAEMASNSGEMRKNAREGNNTVKTAIEHMQKIKEEYNGTASKINSLEKDSVEIGDIATLISDVADQINLLALNAAIEAARAGEHGRGFAVVAEEVRKLSDQTSQSTSKINDLIERIQRNVKTSAESMEHGRLNVDKGISSISDINEMFTNILESIETSADEIENLSSISEEMSASSEEVSASLEEVASTAKQSSENANRVAASSEQQLAIIDEVISANTSLLNMASDLKRIVEQFNKKV